MQRTEVLLGVAPTLALLVQISLWAVLEGVVAVSLNTHLVMAAALFDLQSHTDVVKEVDLILLGKEGGTDAMNRRISPSLGYDISMSSK